MILLPVGSTSRVLSLVVVYGSAPCERVMIPVVAAVDSALNRYYRCENALIVGNSTLPFYTLLY